MKKAGIIILSMITTFSFANEFVSIIKFEEKTAQKVGSATKNISEWTDINGTYDCSSWNPDPSTIDFGLTFTQNRDCLQDQSRTKDIYTVYNTGEEVFEKTVTENQTITEIESQSAVGTKEPFENQLKILASDKQAGDLFGYSVSISGDRAIVGAHGEDTGGSNAGAAYIYQYNGSTWIEQAKLQASDKETGDSFGYSVSISGDTAIVGGYGEDTGGADSGAAYIYQYNGSTWVEQAKLQANDKQAGDLFGYSVSTSGDTAIVGAHGEDTGGSNAGAAYIYQYNGSTWVEQAKLQANDKQAGDLFGYSVSTSGDTAIVGAHGEDTGGSNAGAAYIYQYNGSTWVEQAKLQANDKQTGDLFGVSVSISGYTAIVGAHLEDTGGTDAGAAYIYQYNGSTWLEQGKLQASDKETNDWFGRSVSISGDTAIVGARYEDTGGNDAGAAYIYQYNGSTWLEQAKLQASDKETGDLFGVSVSTSGGTAIVGARHEDTGGKDAGAAYMFD